MSKRKPHERRLNELFRACPPRDWNNDPILAAHVERTWRMDVAAQREFRELGQRLPLLVYSVWASSSGFLMATELRRFWYEYLDRFGRFGPYALPSSFNVLEAFVDFNVEYLAFTLRPERDYLLRFSDYLDWYTASSYPEEPASLIDVMQEGLAYSYNFIPGPNEPLLATHNAKLLVAGVSLIRHCDELAVLVLAGQNPPLAAAMKALDSDTDMVKEKRELLPSTNATEETRLLEGMTDFSRILLAARFDLTNRLHDVRYLMRDRGNSYEVATDDYEMLRMSLREGRTVNGYPVLAQAQTVRLREYSDLFSAAAAAIFLPAFFIDQASRVVTSEFLTKMGEDERSPKVRRLRRELGNDYFKPRVVVNCLTNPQPERSGSYRIDPPDMKFQSTGFWKALEPGQVGTSADGIPIVGKTWVHRSEAWESSAPEEFVAQRLRPLVPEESREYIYVMRSPSHSADIYKIGLTTRSVAARAKELTGSTSAPLPFEILASWAVESAEEVEGRVHKALAPYRLSPRREFFRAPLSEIIRIVNEVVERSVESRHT